MTPIPEPQSPTDERRLLTSLTFFLTSDQRAKVVRVLRSMHERDRTGALLRLIESQPEPQEARS